MSDELEIENLDALDETAASDTIEAKPTFSRSELLNGIVQTLSGKSTEDLNHLADALAISQQADQNIANDASDKNKASVAMKPSATGMDNFAFPFVPVVKEDVKALFDGQTLSEAEVDKAATLFEAAVNARVVLEVTKIEEEARTQLEEACEAIREDLTDKVDAYLNYVVEEWIDENQVAITNTIQVDLIKEFQDKLADLMRESYVEIPEDRVDLVEELAERATSLEEQLADLINEKIEADKEIAALRMSQKFKEVSEGMTVADQEKLRSLVETVEFDGDLNEYSRKLAIIKEANFKGDKPAKAETLNEGEEIVIEVDQDGNQMKKPVATEVRSYVDAISKSIR